MKKYWLLLLAVIGLVFSCEDTTEHMLDSDELVIIQEIDMSDFYVRTDTSDPLGKPSNSKGNSQKCFTMNELNRQLDANPGLYQKMYNIEKHTRQFIAAKKPKGTPGGGPGNGGGGGSDPVLYNETVIIPVIINILEDKFGDVTQEQINTQIAILNEDFNNKNPNTGGAPSEFESLVADVNITFSVAEIKRKISTKSTWGTRNAMKDSGQSGIDATDTSKHLNIWVCNIGGGILGYAQFPGGNQDTDGIVIGSDYFGETSGVYGDGRTATHEVGHWLNLRHIWGDGRCNRDDFVSDTPKSDRYNFGCPTYPLVHCRSADMTMNYMDYVYDDCMYMFTTGQNARMRALFASDGARESFVIAP